MSYGVHLLLRLSVPSAPHHLSALADLSHPKVSAAHRGNPLGDFMHQDFFLPFLVLHLAQN